MSDELEKRFYNFAVTIINIVEKLPHSPAGFAMAKQLFKAGTSIGANYAEAQGAFSKEDFIFKISIAFKEARETCFWLNLAKDSKIIYEDIKSTIKEAEEIRNILGASLRTAKNNTNKESQ